ncbi:RNA polymerase sigma factor [Parapedobacter deserti]|uniref:RNA polymerase sigma factor n=1 Tax=Parapedobacter deserti TaxID=1912957 RepID=A0ABV7JR01_9SPHI
MSANTETYTNDFLGLISANERLIYKVCRVYESDADIRQDMFQEIVLQAWSAYPRYRRAAAFSTWLYRIALNTAITFQRKTKRNMVTNVAELPDVHVVTSDGTHEKYEMMYELIASLPSMEKALVMLYLDDYPYREIADMLGISESNVGTKLARIKDKLRKQAAVLNNV